MKFILCFVLLYPFLGYSQTNTCNIKLSGLVKEAENDLPLEDVSIYIEEDNIFTTTDSSGFFTFSYLCHSDYHLIISHVGCAPQSYFLHIDSDTTLNLYIEHAVNVIKGVIITSKKKQATLQNVQTIEQQDIHDNQHKSLAQQLESITGVHSLKTGSGIAKPIIQGLYGSRITILNNGIPQSGQLWGNDHSPEIDPLSANKLSVIKGVGTVKYMGGNVGGIILVEPQKIGTEPHLHGKASYYFESNGLSNGLNVRLQQYTKALAWKVNGTFKKSGDRHTPTYFLNNTGSEELNFNVQLEKKLSDKSYIDAYFSTFNAYLGVLRSSHISNLTDLANAFSRDEPFFTEEEHSFEINPPNQEVHHHLLKLHSTHYLNDHQKLDLTLAGQLNKRSEFDVRRAGRSSKPVFDVSQYSYFTEVKHQIKLQKDTKLESGIQFNLIDNINEEGTGVLPFIPDYFEYKTGAFVLLNKKINKSRFELGGRYDYVNRNGVISNVRFDEDIFLFNQSYHNLVASLGWNYIKNDHLSFSTNVGYASNNPAINELYSKGLHQGVSSIEEGNADLSIEKSLKLTTSVHGQLNEKFSFEVLPYVQYFNNYIYLRPTGELRLTIRGSFPVFEYDQINALIYGLDIANQYKFSDPISINTSVSLIKGHNSSDDLPLINIPSNRVRMGLMYEMHQPIKIGKKKIENGSIEVTNSYTFKQSDKISDIDFVDPPEGYYLLGLELAADLQLKKTRLRFTAHIENTLNTVYRDYLNKLRYYADDLGFNAILGLNVLF